MCRSCRGNGRLTDNPGELTSGKLTPVEKVCNRLRPPPQTANMNQGRDANNSRPLMHACFLYLLIRGQTICCSNLTGHFGSHQNKPHDKLIFISI